MNNKAKTIIENEIGPGERLQWTGQPRQGIVFLPSDIFMIPFSLLWGGIAISVSSLMMIPAITAKNASFLGAIAILIIMSPFFLIGIYLIFGRFLIDIQIRKNTFYGLTDKRVVIISGINKRKIKSINLRTLTEISYRSKRNDRGSIVFGSTHGNQSAPSNLPWPGMPNPPPSFDMIKNARDVYKKIRDIQLGSD